MPIKKVKKATTKKGVTKKTDSRKRFEKEFEDRYTALPKISQDYRVEVKPTVAYGRLEYNIYLNPVSGNGRVIWFDGPFPTKKEAEQAIQINGGRKSITKQSTKKRSVEPAYNKIMNLIKYMNATADEHDVNYFLKKKKELERDGYITILTTNRPEEAHIHSETLNSHGKTTKIVPFKYLDARVFVLFEK
jgi:hypothetical protein